MVYIMCRVLLTCVWAMHPLGPMHPHASSSARPCIAQHVPAWRPTPLCIVQHPHASSSKPTSIAQHVPATRPTPLCIVQHQPASRPAPPASLSTYLHAHICVPPWHSPTCIAPSTHFHRPGRPCIAPSTPLHGCIVPSTNLHHVQQPPHRVQNAPTCRTQQ